MDVLRLFQDDSKTKHVVLIGEIGGAAEEEAARFIKDHMTKPVVALIAGQTAPADKRMGHAGAIVSGGVGTARDKIAAFQAVGVQVARHPAEVAEMVARLEQVTRRSAPTYRSISSFRERDGEAQSRLHLVQ